MIMFLTILCSGDLKRLVIGLAIGAAITIFLVIYGIATEFGIKKISLFKHIHKWQTRATNRYGKPTYRVCTKCGEAQKWDGFIDGRYVKCERIEQFDKDF